MRLLFYNMYRRRHLAFFSATAPWVWCCCAAWWVDRLLVELGHRTTDSPICIHSDLQYVRYHQAVTIIATKLQTVWFCRETRQQFRRERILLGQGHGSLPCMVHIYLCHAITCVCWTGVLACVFDVSPWLCMQAVLSRRASLMALFGIGAVTSVVLERTLYAILLSRHIHADTIEI